jgi:hypothetical protein
MDGAGVSRRELLAAGAGAGAALALQAGSPADARITWARTLDFRALGPGGGWPGWRCVGVANLRRAGGRGLLEAGSDVFPCDPRPVAFAVDQRFRDGAISATVDRAGAGAGVVLRRVARAATTPRSTTTSRRRSWSSGARRAAPRSWAAHRRVTWPGRSGSR